MPWNSSSGAVIRSARWIGDSSSNELVADQRVGVVRFEPVGCLGQSAQVAHRVRRDTGGDEVGVIREHAEHRQPT